MLVCLACALAALALGGLTLALRPYALVAAPILWLVASLGLHRLSGERASAPSIAFAALFTLPLVLGVLAVYEVTVRWQAPGWAFAGLGAMVIAFALVFARLVIAAGSADYPYDD